MSNVLSDGLESSLKLLRRDDTRQTAANNLRDAVRVSGREMSPEAFAFFEEALFTRIFTMIHSPSLGVKRGAVAGKCIVIIMPTFECTFFFFKLLQKIFPLSILSAMESLLEIISSNLEAKAIKYANTFKHMLSSTTEEVLLAEVAKALGHLAAQATTMQNNDYVEFELNRGIEVCVSCKHTKYLVGS
jgi:hypothetical protein